MDKVTWTTGGETFLVTPSQKTALDVERTEFDKLLVEREQSLKGDYRYNGTHIGNPPDPYKDLAESYIKRVREILGPNPIKVSPADWEA